MDHQSLGVWISDTETMDVPGVEQRGCLDVPTMSLADRLGTHAPLPIQLCLFYTQYSLSTPEYVTPTDSLKKVRWAFCVLSNCM